jgi:uncharacterized protein YrrD
MKRSLKELTGYKLKTFDGQTAGIKDFLFDEKSWVIRYIEADFGSLFKSKKVLIPKAFFDIPKWDKKEFPIGLSKADIDRCPKIEDHLPVSKKYEEQIHKHYQLTPYWSGAVYTPLVKSPPRNAVKEEDLDTLLRSFKEITGYHIRATDETIGHVDDLIIDDLNWHIRQTVFDTSNWVPWSKKVMIAIQWIKTISYGEGMIQVNLPVETIKNSPEYDPDKAIDTDYERLFNDYFSRSLVK